MKHIDNLDSLQHLDFPTTTSKDKRDKFGSFLLAVVGMLGLFAISNPNFQQSTTDSLDKDKANKFWLTPSSLNSETTAFKPSLIHSTQAGSQLIVSTDVVATKSLN